MKPSRYRPFAASPLVAPLHEPRYLDDDLLGGHRGLQGLREKAALWRARAVERAARDAARRLAALGGAEPDIETAEYRL